jgi:hypothetical protein
LFKSCLSYVSYKTIEVMNYDPSGPKIRKKKAAKERDKLINIALAKDIRPTTLQALKALQVNGLLPWEVFKDNIGKIFPLILSMVAEGHSITYIESVLGLRASGLSKFIQLHPRLKRACNEARKVKKDRTSLEKIDLDFILS